MSVAINRPFSLHSEWPAGMRGKAAVPRGPGDSQEWHKIAIGFSESPVTGIYRRALRRERLNEIARRIQGNLLVKIPRREETTVSREIYFTGLYGRTIYGRVGRADKNAGWAFEFRYRRSGDYLPSLSNIFFIIICVPSLSLSLSSFFAALSQ